MDRPALSLASDSQIICHRADLTHYIISTPCHEWALGSTKTYMAALKGPKNKEEKNLKRLIVAYYWVSKKTIYVLFGEINVFINLFMKSI